MLSLEALVYQNAQFVLGPSFRLKNHSSLILPHSFCAQNFSGDSGRMLSLLKPSAYNVENSCVWTIGGMTLVGNEHERAVDPSAKQSTHSRRNSTQGKKNKKICVPGQNHTDEILSAFSASAAPYLLGHYQLKRFCLLSANLMR